MDEIGIFKNSNYLFKNKKNKLKKTIYKNRRIRFKNKNIADVLDMTVDEGCNFFENIQTIKSKLITLKHVGLGYMKIGQQATTLSGD